MSDEKSIYNSEAARYEALINREDHLGNIPAELQRIRNPQDLDIIDLGAGTGRLASMLVPGAASLLAFDQSYHMLAVARDKFRRLDEGRQLATVADHRRVPVPAHSADMVVSGWSISYLAVWNQEGWRAELDAWLVEMGRILRPGGSLVLFESLGTGNETPVKLPHLANFYPWLDQAGFESTWVRTDYRFPSVEEAAELAGFFFGQELAVRIRTQGLTILPECTGIWWKTVSAA